MKEGQHVKAENLNNLKISIPPLTLQHCQDFGILYTTNCYMYPTQKQKKIQQQNVIPVSIEPGTSAK